MRHDILEIDTLATRADELRGTRIGDAEAIRLMLSGSSVIDWSAANFPSVEDVDRFLELQRYDHADPCDKARLAYLYHEAVAYAEEMLDYRMPTKIRSLRDPRKVFQWASDTSGFRRNQMLSCIVLKLMHVLHHLEAADLKHHLPISEAELLHLGHRDVVAMGDRMRQSGVPLVAFHGSRKTRRSVVSKLLSKRDNIAATIFDKLRFRIVVPEKKDLVTTLTWMVRHALPFNYIIPGQSHNNLLDPDLVDHAVSGPTKPSSESDLPVREAHAKNEFSGSSYQMINFIADFPVLLSETHVPRPIDPQLGRVVFVMAEFQLVDEQTALRNEEGDNAHFHYKRRQHRVVHRRLTRGDQTLSSADDNH